MLLRVTLILLGLFWLTSGYAMAQTQNAAPAASAAAPISALTNEQRMNLAREFVARIKKGFQAADANPNSSVQEISQSEAFASRGFKDGDELFFQIMLKEPRPIELDNNVTGYIKDGKLLLSLGDLFKALDFVIDVDPAAGKAKGWYIRENKHFQLDLAKREVLTDHGAFKVSPEAMASEDGHIFATPDEISKWFNLTLGIDAGKLTIDVHSKFPLPIQEKMMRKDMTLTNQNIGPPELPMLANSGPKNIALPFVDVSTTSTYNRNGKTGESDLTHNGYLSSAGDFMGGTLSTQSIGDSTNGLTNERINYKRESIYPDLLGPLKARRYELGDVIPVDIPLLNNRGPEAGVRITNVDPLRSSISPVTTITGQAPPGWDVELYREDTLVAFQSVENDGIYMFNNVNLFGQQNNMKLVFYGPQGEVREEKVNVPLDPQRLAEQGSAYDVSVTMNDVQAYKKDFGGNDDGKGQPDLSALYEKSLGPNTALSLGLQSDVINNEDGERKSFGEAGLSTSLGGALLNLNYAVQDNGEMASEATILKDIGKNELRDTTTWATDHFESTSIGNGTSNFSIPVITSTPSSTTSAAAGGSEVFANEFNATGPLPFNIKYRTNYNVNAKYALDSEGNQSFLTGLGYNFTYDRLGFNQQYIYSHDDLTSPVDQLRLISSVNGTLDKYRLRFLANQEVAPQYDLGQLVATAQRSLSENVDAQASIQRDLDQKLTSISGQIDWNTGHALVSPGVSYDSDGNLQATLNLRAGLAYSHGLKSYDAFISNYGGLNVFVFLDKNGDNVFDGDDEPIENALVRVPQSAGSTRTGKDGIAFINHAQSLKPTDVFIDPDSLEDPDWISGYEGASVIPHQGSVIEMMFPVHISGQVEGTLEVMDKGASARVQNIEVQMIPIDGVNKKTITTDSESDGYYLESHVPPGVYLLTVNPGDAKKVKSGAQAPEIVAIGYKGDVLSKKNIALVKGRISPPIRVEKVESGVKPGGQLYALKVLAGNSTSLLNLLRRFGVTRAPKALFENLMRLDVKKNTQSDVVYYRFLSNDPSETYDRCQSMNESGVACEFVAFVRKPAPAAPPKTASLN